MNHLIRKFLFFSFFFASTNLIAQESIAVHLTKKDGLPDREIYNILEDDSGFIWLAADKGLFKYDGANFESRTHPKQIGLSVFQLTKDNDNVVWFTNIANQLFYIKEDKITLFGDFKEQFKGTLTVVRIHNNLITLFTETSFIILDKNTGEIKYEHKKESINDGVNFCFIEPYFFKNSVFFGDRYSNFYEVNLTTFKRVYHNNLSSSYHQINKVFKRSSPIKTKDYLVYFVGYKGDIKTKSFYKIPLNLSEPAEKLETTFPDVVINSVYNYNKQLWFCTSKGVYVCELLGNQLKIIDHLLKKEFITDLVIDYNKNYWFSSLNKGLFIIPNIAVGKISLLPKDVKIEKFYLGNTNELLITTSGKKLYRYNVKTTKIDKLSFHENEHLMNVTFNSFSKEYYLYLKHKTQIINTDFKKRKKYDGTASIKKIDFLDEKKLIAATSSAVGYFKLSFDKKILHQERNEEYIRGYTCFYNHKNKQSYFGSSEGLLLYNSEWEKQNILYLKEPIYINGITQIPNGDLWCNSFKNGVYVVRDNKVIMHYTIKNGLLSNKNSYIVSNDSQVWLAGDNGIQQFDIKNKVFKNLTKKDGIPSYDYKGLALFDDNVYITTPNQVYTFNYQNFFKDKTLLEPYFTSITIADKKEKIKPVYELKYDQNKLKITFNSNGFLSKEHIEYKYRLLGSTNKWEGVSQGVNQVNFNSLSQGEYSFQLKAFNGEKSSEIKEIKFIIEGVYYKQWWFYVLISLLVITLIWWFFNRRNHRLAEKQNIVLEKKHQELENVFLKLESLRSQMNPHFIFNALNSIQDYVVHNNQKLARKYLVKFSRLIRVYLEHSQKDTISLQEEIDTLLLYLQLEKERFEETFNYKVIQPNNFSLEKIQIPTFLIQPYVENAIKHGLLHKRNDRDLQVSFIVNTSESNLECIISDNGVGRVASREINSKKFLHKSFSSEANEKRISLLNKTKEKPLRLVINDNYDEEGIATGTTVFLKIPIKI